MDRNDDWGPKDDPPNPWLVAAAMALAVISGTAMACGLLLAL